MTGGLPLCQGLILEEALANLANAGVTCTETEDVTPAKGTQEGDVLRVIRVREDHGVVCLTVGRFPPERI